MNYNDQMASSFSPEYARHLGYWDARHAEVGRRSFSRHETDRRTLAYWQGVKDGEADNLRFGLDMRCMVRWDNPGFDTKPCGCKNVSHMTFAYGNVFPVCEWHYKTPTENMSFVPIGWL